MGRIIWCTTALVLAAGCSSSGGSGSGTSGVPDIASLAREIVPIVGSARRGTERIRGLVLGRLTYDTDGFTANQLAIEDVFGSKDVTPAVNTKIDVQLDQISSTLEGINAEQIAADGTLTNCTTTLTSSDSPSVAGAFPGDAIFWTEDDSGKYQCYISRTGDSPGGTVVGKAAIASPPSGCTDAFEYYILNGYTMGTSTDGGHQIQRIYYNGCTKDLKIAMALTTVYSSNQDFFARFELVGNVDTHTFQTRVAKMDAEGVASGSYNLIEAAGVSKVASGTGAFVMKFRQCNQTDATCATPTTGPKTMCIQVTGTDFDYTQLTSGTSVCDTYETPFNEVTGSNGLVRGDVSQTVVDYSTSSAFGL